VTVQLLDTLEYVAKKKSRVPTPPRPVGAPKRPVQPQRARKDERTKASAGDPRRTRMWFLALAGVVAAVALGIGLATALGGSEDASAALAAAGCTDQTFPNQGRGHVTQLPKGFKYNSFPPTSGKHHPQWAIWNIYDRPVQQIHLVHNLEHGGIVVQYGDKVPAAQVDEIRAWYTEDPTAVIVAPLPALHEKVALTAWTHLAMCPGFDEKAFNAFRGAHQFKGPERYPADRLQPGM
jgi:hypothetical protein